jgi:hypothetical protein
MHFSLFRASLGLCWMTAAFGQISPHAPASGGIAGIVLDANNVPVRRAIITLSTVETPPQDAVAWTDANGRFSFSYVPAGRYQLRATKAGYQPAVYGAETARVPSGIIKLAAGESRTDFIFHLRGMSSISGAVFDEDGDPFAGVRITAMRLGFRRQKRTLLGGPGTTTDANGRFRLNVFQPGRYVVVAAHDYRLVFRINSEVDAGHAQQQYSYGTQFYPGTDQADSATILNIQEGQEVPSIDFRLVARPAVSLRGKVILPSEVKSAITNVSISVTSEGLDSNFGMGASPPDYTFRNDQLASGAYRLVAQASIEGRNYRGVQSIDLGPQGPAEVTIALEPGIDLSGRVWVEGPDAQKYSASFVSLVPGDGMLWNGQPLRAGVNKDGSFKIAGVPPGVWDINAGPIPPGGYLKSMRLGDQDVLTEDMTIQPSTAEQLNIVLSTRAAAFEGDVTEGDQPARAVVLLAPEEKFRHVLSFYRLATADDRGHFEIKRAAPGRYRLFAFDEFDERSIQDPDFLKPFESRGVPVVLREGANDAQKLSRILSGNPQLPSDVHQSQTAGAVRGVQQ